MKYVYMLEFEAPNDFVAEDVLGTMHEAVLDIDESGIEGAKLGSQVLIRGRTISESELAHDKMREDQMNAYHYEGINQSPLPDGMPEL